MDLKPVRLAHARTASATFPLTHGSRPNDVSEPFADNRIPRHVQYTSAARRDRGAAGTEELTSPINNKSDSSHRHFHSHSRSHSHSRRDPFSLDRPKLTTSSHTRSHSHTHRHKHNKSRELRLPRPMSHLASSASARGLLPGWPGSGRDKERDDDGLLRPTREMRDLTTTRSGWGSESTRGTSRRGSLLDVPEQHERLGPIRRREIQSLEDLEEVKRRRKQGEEYLRSALSSIGTQATDVTRRLDYTYYNLLEKITALNSTIGSFQELSDSAGTFLNDFERETSSLDQEIRKQIIELKGFEPQIEKADKLETRMKQGREKVETLGKRLETVKTEIESWERREMEWQERTSRRLRIFWAIVGSAFMVLVLGVVLQNWPSIGSDGNGTGDLTSISARAGAGAFLNQSDAIADADTDTTPRSAWESILQANGVQPQTGSWYPSTLADRRQSLQASATSSSSSSSLRGSARATDTEHDPLRVLDGL